METVLRQEYMLFWLEINVYTSIGWSTVKRWQKYNIVCYAKSVLPVLFCGIVYILFYDSEDILLNLVAKQSVYVTSVTCNICWMSDYVRDRNYKDYKVYTTSMVRDGKPRCNLLSMLVHWDHPHLLPLGSTFRQSASLSPNTMHTGLHWPIGKHTNDSLLTTII